LVHTKVDVRISNRYLYFLPSKYYVNLHFSTNILEEILNREDMVDGNGKIDLKIMLNVGKCENFEYRE
jgi:hypothetical protein